MFWKKKNDDGIIIEMDINERTDRRNCVRIQPLNKIYFDCSGQQYQITDISSAGLAFKSDILTGQNSLDIVIQLPTNQSADNEVNTIVCTIKIVHTHNNIFHCQFTGLDFQSQRQLDHFILDEQKRLIRSKN